MKKKELIEALADSSDYLDKFEWNLIFDRVHEHMAKSKKSQAMFCANKGPNYIRGMFIPEKVVYEICTDKTFEEVSETYEVLRQ